MRSRHARKHWHRHHRAVVVTVGAIVLRNLDKAHPDRKDGPPPGQASQENNPRHSMCKE